MVNHCVVKGCRFKYSTRNKNPNTANVSLHSFPNRPSQENIRNAWIKAIGRDNWTPSKTSAVCSQHFRIEDMDLTGQTRRLKEGAVPSIFPTCSKYLPNPQEEGNSSDSHGCQIVSISSDTVPLTETENLLASNEKNNCLCNSEIMDCEMVTLNETTNDSHIHNVSSMNNLLNDVTSDFNEDTGITITDEACRSNEIEKNHDDITPRKRKLKKQLDNSNFKLTSARKKIKVLQQKIRRKNKKIYTNQEIINTLLEEKYLTYSAVSILEKTLPAGPCSLVKRAITNKNKNTESRSEYDPELRTFALTLHYLSPKAYEYVRSKFNNALPSSRTIRGWYMKINCEPGFSEECFHAIEQKIQEGIEKNIDPYVCLSIDDMCIKESEELDRNNKVIGYVDLGTGDSNSDMLPTAKMACVIMCTALNMPFKVPCGYFFAESLSGCERANLISTAIHKVCELKATVAAVTFDGAASNLAMANSLGADVTNPINPTITFTHQAQPDSDVHLIFDACHMLKLIRNCLSEKGIIYMDGKAIRWSYIESLVKLQTQEGLRLANKVSKRHLNWRKRKMNVRLAAQTLSRSVAKAIEYCNTKLEFEEFKGSEETVKFIMMMDRIFDLLNSSSRFGKELKAPLLHANQHIWRPFIAEAVAYIDRLSTDPVTHSPVLHSNRKVGFLGFKVSLLSVQSIFDKHIGDDLTKYLLTYKLSQDHLELFFGLIRQRGGFNNNPTCLQFKYAFKRLIVRNELKDIQSGNCISQKNINMLSVSSSSTNRSSQFIETDNEFETLTSLVIVDHDYIPSISSLTLFVEDVVEYISGNVARHVLEVLKCDDCKAALTSDGKYRFIEFKNNGGLISPSRDVVKICKMTERCYREALVPNLNVVLSRDIPSAVAEKAFDFGIFQSLSDHAKDLDPFDTHINNLIKIVSSTYQKLRIYHSINEKKSKNVDHRSTYNRLAIFKHL